MDFLLILMMGVALGYYTVCRVPSVFHAPLMSLTNGVSSICILVILEKGTEMVPKSLEGFWILVCATVMILCLNIVGGFDITQRMISFFYPAGPQETFLSTLKKWGVFFASGVCAFLMVGLGAVMIEKLRIYVSV
ncbi:proton-translocating transhydrogenase family protein [Holospora curviuscula]|uniref:proton-translocating NAD(P)(+) transhydrogenase n=1 Tax=Holospora curviuscula TaxID=1082868 RepID=A0A2S5R9H9_9PROT|nr:proton-translocating transhydrogenase family protein [Holospora curviuscula]PPE03957.1 NAD(P) transhydrogenase subunit alpha [Holospora curviuscula]